MRLTQVAGKVWLEQGNKPIQELDVLTRVEMSDRIGGSTAACAHSKSELAATSVKRLQIVELFGYFPQAHFEHQLSEENLPLSRTQRNHLR